MDEETRTEHLNRYYKEVHATILTYQSAALGLFPRGDTQHARVRDNVMVATGLWHLSLAYRQMGDDQGRTFELEQCTVKCMRGILFCYMRQADKVEKFKHRQVWEDALHARFDCYSGDEVMDHNNWGHLQIDSSALFLLMVAQMTASGVQIIFTMDEVNFIQNLVYYVERAYRIPDFGIWERGSRDNVGRRELHASSIGMAKAALEAMNGLNLFGERGCPQSTIHVDPDAQYRNWLTLNTLLPRESTSKETDASLLTITGYPAFAIDDSSLREETEVKVQSTLAGERGYKRFLRDSYLTVREGGRKFKEPIGDTSIYEGVECEWPIFFLYVYISEMCRGNVEEAEVVWKKLENSLSDFEDHVIVPQLYFVPESELSDEIGTSAGSMVTLRDITYKLEVRPEPMPFLWAQSLFYSAKLLRDGLISVPELDPLGLRLLPHTRQRGVARHLGFKAPGHDVIIQVALIAETSRLQTLLATHGIPTQTQRQVEPIKIRPPGDILMKVYGRLGENEKLGLTGRPQRPLGALATSRVYRIFGQTCVFYPTDSMADFYTSFDVMTLIDVLKTTLEFLNLNWNMAGRPTLCLYLTENRLKGSSFRKFVNFLAQLKHGEVDGLKVRVDRLQSLIRTSCIERLECGQWSEVDKQLQQKLTYRSVLKSRGSAARLSCSLSSASEVSISSVFEEGAVTTPTAEERELHNLEDSDAEEVEPRFLPTELRDKKGLQNMLLQETNSLGKLYVLHELMRAKETLSDGETAEEKIETIYQESGVKKHWMAVRYAAALLRKVVDCLAPSMTAMLVRGKEVTIGVFGYAETTIMEPLSPKEIVKIIYDMCFPSDPIEAVLQQEIIIYLADVFTSHPSLFHGILRLRIGWIIQAMKIELRHPQSVEKLQLSTADRRLEQLAPHQVKQLLIIALQDDDSRSPLSTRQLHGALNRVPPLFYEKVYSILERAGGINVRGNTLSQVLTVYASGQEVQFALKVEEVLSTITIPEYRQLVVEILMVVSTVLERNPEINFSNILKLDELLEESMHLYSVDRARSEEATDSPGAEPGEENSGFFSLFPDGQSGTVSYMAKAVVNRLLQQGLSYDTSRQCCIS